MRRVKVRKGVAKAGAKFGNSLRKEGILVVGWGVRNILLITILIGIQWVLFILSDVRSALNNTLEAQPHHLENVLVIT